MLLVTWVFPMLLGDPRFPMPFWRSVKYYSLRIVTCTNGPVNPIYVP